MKMKKIAKYLTALICLVTLSGCGKSATIEETRTIVLDIDSEVVPTFSSNFGSGSYDANTKKYTHTIDYIKDLYIFLSYGDLKTVTVHIPTKDMKEKVLTKSVEFGEELDAEVEVTVEGVKNLEGLEIENKDSYYNIEIGSKNTFRFFVPSREENYNLKFTLPNYKEFDIDITKEDLVSGKASIDTIALTTSQVYIGLEGKGYEYKVYSNSTNEVVASGNNYDNFSSINYVVLPNDTAYYIKASPYNKNSRLYKVPVNESIIINLGNNNTSSVGYLRVESSTENYVSTRLYDKDEGVILNGNSLYKSIESYGLLAEKEDKMYYLDDLASKVIRGDYEYNYTVSFDDMEEVSFDITKIHVLTKEIISNSRESYFNVYGEVKATLTNNVFYVTSEEVYSGEVSIDLYTKDNVKVGTVENDIYSWFLGDIFSGTIDYEGKTIPYTFPVFLEDLVHNGHTYTYPNQTINVDVSLLTLYFVNDYGDIQYLSESDFVMDEEKEPIMGSQVGSNAYFELEVNKTYSFKYNDVNYSFTVSNDDIEKGSVYIDRGDVSKIQVKIPKGTYLVVDQFNGMNFYPNSEGFVEVPIGERKYLQGYVSNGYVNSNSKNIATEDGSICEFSPFYVVNGGSLNWSDSYNVNKFYGSNNIQYMVIELNDENSSYPIEVNTNIKVVLEVNISNYKINLNNFVYNEEYKAYYYDLEANFDHVLVFEYENEYMRINWSDAHYKYFYYDYINNEWMYKVYVNDNMIIESEDGLSSYTITSNDSKVLNVKLEWDYQEQRDVIIVNQND